MLLAVGLSTISAPAVHAFQITGGAFDSSATVESFEGLSPGSNVTSAGGGILVPGVNAPYTFTSGATLSSPNTNADLGISYFVGDFSIGDATFSLGDNGTVASAADIPSGTAYFGYNDFASSGPVEFTFDSNISLVGAYVNTSVGSDLLGLLNLSAFDGDGNLLETVSLSSVQVGNWSTNFLGVQNSGIRKIQFSGDFFVLDTLTFQTNQSVEVPEPPVAMFVVPVFGGLVVMLRRRKAAQFAHARHTQAVENAADP